MKKRIGIFAVLMAFTLVAAACGGDDGSTTEGVTDTGEEAAHVEGDEEAAHHESAGLEMTAPFASITVDGDSTDWEGIDALDLTLEGITSETVEPKNAHLKAAHDDEFIYLLLTVEDDFDWNADEVHESGASSIMWRIDSEAGPHMGTESEGEIRHYESLGMVDIWHWEPVCAMGERAGGAASGATDGDDPICDFDDEWATDPVERKNDNGEGAENSLLGVFSHSNPVIGGEGTWTFEFSRPLQTGDSQDAQFSSGATAQLAVAYWDADNTESGWNDAEHVQSSYLGWIEVSLTG